MPDPHPSTNPQVATGFRAVLATERPIPSIDRICGPCGVPLTPIKATDNATKHACDGDYEWIADA